MEALPKDNPLIKFNADTLEAVRKDLNLDSPIINESIRSLKDWLRKQTHFSTTDFSQDFLEITLITCKGSLERAKERLDKLCVLKFLMPEFLTENIREEFSTLMNSMNVVILPSLTPDHIRIVMYNFNDGSILNSEQIFKLFKLFIVIGEYLRRYEYCNGFRLILDYRGINILKVVTQIKPVELKKAMTFLIEGYGMRVKSIHILSESKVIDSFVTLFKQVVSNKIGNRIHVHKQLDPLYEFIPKDILPAEYGGKEKPMAKLAEQCLDVLSSEEHMRYIKEMNKAIVNGSYRLVNSEENLGLPGSFRSLNVD